MSSRVVLRPARDDDTDALVAVWRRAVEATHHFLAPSDVDGLERLVRRQALPAVDLTVAERDGEPVGFVGTSHAPGDDVAVVEMLFVSPDAHGLGIGAALLEHAAAGHPETRLDVNEQNPAALGFYLARGFTVTGRAPTDGQGRPFPLLHLRRVGAPGAGVVAPGGPGRVPGTAPLSG